MTPRVLEHQKSKKVSEEYLLQNYFSNAELEAIVSGPSIATRKTKLPLKKSKKRRKKS